MPPPYLLLGARHVLPLLCFMLRRRCSLVLERQRNITAPPPLSLLGASIQILFTSEDITWTEQYIVWAFILWQYGVFGAMALFAMFVPDVPRDVTIQLERQRFITSKVVDQVRFSLPRARALLMFFLLLFCVCVRIGGVCGFLPDFVVEAGLLDCFRSCPFFCLHPSALVNLF